MRWGDLLDAKRIAESLDRLEKLRKSLRNSVVFFIVIVLLPFLSIFVESEIYQIYQFCIVGVALIGIIFGSTINKKKRVYKKLYNEVIVRTVFERYFDIREFNSDYGIPYSTIKNTRMMKMGNIPQTIFSVGNIRTSLFPNPTLQSAKSIIRDGRKPL